MIDHYRNLNTEQEYVIAKLKEDLRHSNETGQLQGRQRSDAMEDLGRRELKQPVYPLNTLMTDQYSDEDGRSSVRSKTIPSPKVRFKEQNEAEIESLRSK